MVRTAGVLYDDLYGAWTARERITELCPTLPEEPADIPRKGVQIPLQTRLQEQRDEGEDHQAEVLQERREYWPELRAHHV